MSDASASSEVEGQIDHADRGERAKPDQPERHAPAQPPAAGVDAAPLRRQFALELAAALADAAIQAVAQLGQRRTAAPHDAIPALEAERGAQIHQLDHLGMATGILLHLLQDAEEAFAAGDLVVEAAGEALRHPRAGAAPRRAEHQVVDRGTERVARGAQRCACRARSPRASVSNSRTASTMLRRSWSGSGARPRPMRAAATSSGAAAAISGLAPTVGTNSGCWTRRDRTGAGARAGAVTAAVAGVGRDAAATPPGRGSSSVALVSHGSAKGSSSRSWPAHPRIAQHSISRPGTSPVTWIAIPPDLVSAAQ